MIRRLPQRFFQKHITANLRQFNGSATVLQQNSEDAPKAPPPPLRKLSALEIQHRARKGTKLTMVTAYDYPSAKHAEYADIDIGIKINIF
jgi:hypothetical protein